MINTLGKEAGTAALLAEFDDTVLFLIRDVPLRGKEKAKKLTSVCQQMLKAMVERCNTYGFVPAARRPILEAHQCFLNPTTAPVSLLSSSLELIDAYSSGGSRDGGPLLDYLADHTHGMAAVSAAMVVAADRQQELEAQMQIELIKTQCQDHLNKLTEDSNDVEWAAGLDIGITLFEEMRKVISEHKGFSKEERASFHTDNIAFCEKLGRSFLSFWKTDVISELRHAIEVLGNDGNVPYQSQSGETLQGILSVSGFLKRCEKEDAVASSFWAKSKCKDLKEEKEKFSPVAAAIHTALASLFSKLPQYADLVPWVWAVRCWPAEQKTHATHTRTDTYASTNTPITHIKTHTSLFRD